MGENLKTVPAVSDSTYYLHRMMEVLATMHKLYDASKKVLFKLQSSTEPIDRQKLLDELSELSGTILVLCDEIHFLDLAHFRRNDKIDLRLIEGVS
jgi:hypothetical protein